MIRSEDDLMEPDLGRFVSQELLIGLGSYPEGELEIMKTCMKCGFEKEAALELARREALELARREALEA